MNKLKAFLDDLRTEYHQVEFLSSDPLEFVHRYENPMDQEAVALISALLAYGNVKQIRRSIAQALERISSQESSPSRFVLGLGHAQNFRAANAAFKGWVHRFNTGEDLVLLLWLLQKSWKKYGSLGGHFMSGLSAADPNIAPALNRLISDWEGWAHEKGCARASFQYFLTAPENGSCCKRWCMFLRWMGRKDAVDLGLWTERGALAHTLPEGRSLKARQLILPLDTHTGRITRHLGLTSRKNADWKAALEVTERLRECDSRDPTSYDFAISRLGILDLCQKPGSAESAHCSVCSLSKACLFRRRGVRNARGGNL